MKKLLLLLPLLIFAVACEGNPASPSDSDDDQDQNQTVIINIGGDHNHEGGKGDEDDSDDVPDVNQAPFILPVASQENIVGECVNVTVNASDPDGDDLTFSWVANTAPRNLTLQKVGPTTALISGCISSSSATDSPFSTTVIVTDPEGLQGSATFGWVVLEAEQEGA